MAAVIFPDGALYRARTWAQLERDLRADSWNPSNSEKFRKELALRARNWSGAEVDRELVTRQFFQELEAAGLLLIVDEEVS